MNKQKVLVITRHAIANYGSLLQAVATQKAVENLGVECKIIDYIRKDEYHANSTVTIAKTKKRIRKNPVLFMLYCIIRFPENVIINRKFEKMRKKILPMTECIHTKEELRNKLEDADYYMTGSDQVFGPVLYGGYDWSYFLDFVPDSRKKIAYAASFGKMEIDSEDAKKMQRLLNRYDHVAVRENQAVGLLKEWNIDANQVIDPTLLFNAQEWKKLINYSDNKNKNKYVLIYQIHNNKELSDYAKKFAKKMNLPLVRVSAMIHQCFKGGKFVAVPKLSDFLTYINNAAYIVTDSFHGTAFAINFNTPFVTLMPKTGTSARNISLLELTGLTGQIAKDAEDFHVLDKKVDFSKANEVLELERKRSIDILKSMI